jgi:tetratricopeptide (TPR) repeat protein
MPTPVQFKYHAFLSYAHADVDWAKWLHNQLEGFRIDQDLVGRETSHGVVPKTLRPIFRDTEDFSGGDSLTDATVAAIDQSAALIVLCSAASATRPAVNEEVRLFRWRHPDRPVIPVIVDGTFPDNFPHALRFEIASDGSITDRPVTILGPDLREEADGRQLGLAKIVAGLIGVDSDDIYRRAERARRAATRFRNAVIAVLAVLTIASAAAAALYARELRTNVALLDATLAQFTSFVDTAVKLADAYGVPLAVTRAMLEKAEGTLAMMTPNGRDAPKIEYRKAAMLAAFSDNYRDLGQTATAKQRLDEAQQIMADLVRRAPSNNDYLFAKAHLHGSAGALLSTLGNREASVREYQARHEIMTRLAPTDPGNVGWQLELALSRTSLVDTYSMRDVTATALQGYREGLALIERLAVAEPGNAKLQRQLGNALTSIGFALWQQGNIEGAHDNIAKALAIDQKLAAAEPNNAGLQRDLAKSQMTMAGIRNVLADRKGALPSAESASAILRRLTTSDPDNAALRSDLAFADMVVAILRAETDHSDASLALARSARDSVGKLVESDPGNFNLRQQIGLFDLQLGDSLTRSDQQAALAILRSARLSFQQLGDQDPTNGMNQMMLVFSDGKIGKALSKAGDPGLALESYRSAVELAGKLARSDPSNAVFKEALAGSLKDLGEALMAGNEVDEAFGIFQAELAARRQLAATDPARIDWLADILNARNQIAEALDKQGKSAEAVATNRETIAEGEHFAEKAPDSSSIALALFASSGRPCAAAVQRNDVASVASDCERMLEFLRRLVRLDPDNAGYKELLEKLAPPLQLTMQFNAANEAGRHAEALALKEQIAARVEGEEVKSAGKPGKATAEELVNLASQALLAGEPGKALAACDRSLSLQPGDLSAELNRAHALMYLDRGAEARTAYEAHKADLFPDDNKPWPQVVAEDFAELRKAGRAHPLMAEVEAALGIAGKP